MDKDPARVQYVRQCINAIEQHLQQGDVEACDVLLYKAFDNEWNLSILSTVKMLKIVREEYLHKDGQILLSDVLNILIDQVEALKQPTTS